MLFFLLPCIGDSYLFDWNQLIAGVGMWPAHANAGLSLLIALIFLRWLPRVPSNLQPCPSIRACVLAWICAACVYGVVAIFLSDGVSW